MKNSLVVIPARGGSKGVPQKNIKPLKGKPLIYYTIDAARALFDDRNIVVSTDDELIRSVVQKYGINVPFLRPPTLATDTASTNDVILHAVAFAESQGLEFDKVILLQPTSPFRTATHISEALALYHDRLEMVVSVKEAASNPYFVLFEENNAGFLQKFKSGDFVRRQDCPKVWEYNGAIYVINLKALRSKPLHGLTLVRKYVMDEYASHDIDTMFDWLFAEFLAEKMFSDDN